MGTKPVYIADGHHRYTTALQYQYEQEQANGGKPLPPAHPANWCMFVLVGMQDDGLLILPTHRLIGGLDRFDIDDVPRRRRRRLRRRRRPRSAPTTSTSTSTTSCPLQPAAHVRPVRRPDEEALPAHAEEPRRAQPPRAQPERRLAAARRRDPPALPARRGPPAQVRRRQGADQGLHRRRERDRAAGGRRRSTRSPCCSSPRRSARSNSSAKHGEVMPQKSTYFFPKLATGMVIHSLKPNAGT